MAILKPFKAYRPPQSIVKELASRPYDVLNSEEARQEAGEKSLLHIIKPEIDFEPGVNVYDERIYNKAKENLDTFIEKGWLKQDEQPNLYIYAQIWGEHKQYGLVGCAGVEDYLNNVIKKHELTRKAKEEDRMKHVRVTNANMEPVFFTYQAVDTIDQLVEQWVDTHQPEYDFVADDGFGHQLWVVNDQQTIQQLLDAFDKVPATYVADGHHRTAAAALVGAEKKSQNPNHTGNEEYNYFMAVHFPHNQLKIIDYNRVVKDLNGLSESEFLQKLEQVFVVQPVGSEAHRPEQLHVMSMYLNGQWYRLEAQPHTYNDNDPIERLDVNVLSVHVLDNILGIKDLRTDERVDFVGGIRGLGELERRVNSGEMKVAFALYPVSLEQLIDIADSGEIMPPKTTWFEPKLRSGLVIHTLDEE